MIHRLSSTSAPLLARLLSTWLLAILLGLAGCGGGDSPATAPQVTTQPVAATVAEGSAVSFNVVASGSGPMAIQWQRNGVDIAGATTSTYTLPQARVSDDGASYAAVLHNDVGTATSSAAVLSVTGAVGAQTVGSAGGTLALNSNGVQFTVAVPAGALAVDTAMTMRSLPPVGTEAARIDVAPAGIAFATPVTVTMTLPADRSISARYLGALQVGTRKTFVPSTVDLAARTVTLHLGYFGMNGAATPNQWRGQGRHALSAKPLDAPAPQPTNMLTLEELAILQPQKEAVDAALVDLQFQGRFQDAAVLQLSIAALVQSAQVPEWQMDALTFVKQAGVTVCAALDHSIAVAAASPVASYGDYQRVAKDIVYWEGASQALGAEGCTGNGWLDTLHSKLDEALTFVSGKVNPPPPANAYGPVAGEIRGVNDLANESTLLRVPSVKADTRQLYIDPALQPVRLAAFDSSQSAPDQSEYLTLLGAFGATPSLSDDAQYAATTFTVASKTAAGDARGSQSLGRGSSVGTPVRTATVPAATDGTVQIAGSIAVLHCPNPATERLQVLFEGKEVAVLDSSADNLLGGGNALPTLQVSALLRTAGIDPAKATSHTLQIKRVASTCVSSYGITDDVLATVTLSFAAERKIFFSRYPYAANSDGQGNPGGRGIESINADGTGRAVVTVNDLVEVCVPDGSRPSCGMFDDKNDTQPTLSPDGRQLLFARQGRYGQPSGIVLANANGSGQTLLTNQADVSPSWSPDGKRVAFVRGGAKATLWVMNIDGSNALQLTSMTRIEGTAWSPDGKSIAFSGDEGGDVVGVYLAASDGSTPPSRVLPGYFGPVSASAWSPDGKKITFGYGRIVNADGTGLTLLPRTIPNSPFAWSPDGSEVAFIDCPNYSCALFAMKSDGSGLRQLTSFGLLVGVDQYLSWR